MNAELKTEAYLAAIVTSSDDAIISKDLNGNIRSWNPSAERIFGYTAQEAIGKHISIIIPPDRLNEEDMIIGKVRRGEKIEHFETTRRHKNGGPVEISVTVSPVVDEDGQIIGASKIARDISERLRAEFTVSEAGLRKDEFIANMSHELRTPMNAVIGLASILHTMELPEKAKKCVEVLRLSADNMMDLINDMLDFAKIENGSMELENIEFDLPKQMDKIVSVAGVKAQEKGLKLFASFSDTTNQYYCGDPLRIHQIVMNLVSNAVKFTQTGSVEIKVDTKTIAADKSEITIAVSDTGIGIAPDKLASIFGKFTQVDSSITRRFGGSGLGLSIAEGLAQKMGGTIDVSSQLGIGSVFTVTLVLSNSDRLEDMQMIHAASVKEERPVKNVLLVDDYEANTMVASNILEHLGYTYDIASNGIEAMRKFIHGNYDVILMDVQMHELDGLEATRRIRKMEAEKGLARTTIIALTAHIRDQDRHKCADAGMDDFIPKPFNLSEISQKLHHHIRKPLSLGLKAV